MSTQNSHTIEAVPQRERERRRPWMALLVLLCVGMLMIVLDATIVNVALPSIQDDLGFSQSSLAWVVNAYLIAFGGLLLLAGRLGDLIGRRRDLPRRPGASSPRASLLCGARAEPGDAGRRPLRPGHRRRDDLGRDPRDDRDDVPRAARAGEGDRRLRFVASAGGSIGLLAGGVLTQAINWHWIFFVNLPIGDRHRAARAAAARRATRASASARAPTSPARC